MTEVKDTIVYNGEEFEVQQGLTVADIRESMSQVYASISTADVQKIDNDDGTYTYRITERAGDKG